ncbi:predicted protein [Naegleria gruberi]|uniref:Predicted protein n=1 Tax=Naegleria gruberi TaxID=5762 RepID=D2VWU6_NAEGR|nr:uncharacterized protein NAEGRDRAFT_81515 [Naegleria gruberi]EFC38755.1 predicted protein [Naegleria gruberi]|eukprot:XP_002671499.1 predicted protein [Naegleria gruberi strain NEG-M]
MNRSSVGQQRAATIMIPNSSLVKHYSVSQTCFKSGVMTKQGAKVKNYKSRYFFLYSNKITYHKMNKKKEPNKTPQGEISLKGVQSLNIYEMKTIEPKAQKEGLQFGFIVEDQERSRNYFLFTETKEETLEWIEAIRQVVTLSNDALQLTNNSAITNTSPIIVDDQTATPVLTKQPSFEISKGDAHLLHKSIDIKRLSNLAALGTSPTTPRGGLNSPRGVTSSPVYISSSNSTSSFSTANTTVLLQKNSHESELTDISSSSNSTSFLEMELPPESFVQTEEGMSPLLYDSGNSVRNSSMNQTQSYPSIPVQVMSDEDEYNIALNSAAIFLKDEKQRTPQEQAYVIAMHHFRRQMQDHIRRYSCKPVYNLAVGTVIFCIPEEERTADEEEFYQDLMEQFRGNVEMYKQATSIYVDNNAGL